jgi:hypothetical protein
MNKYLIKIAEKKDDKKSYGGEAVVGVLGAGVAGKQYHEGHLTGRATYYHGSTHENAKHIKEEGIIPRKSKGIIDKVDTNGSFKKVNEGLSFATKTKHLGHFYAAQARNLHHAKDGDQLSVHKTQLKATVEGLGNHLADSLRLKKDKGVTKLNVPTWKHEVKSKMIKNPELDADHAMFMDAATKKELGEHTMTHKGTIPPKFIPGSRHYQKNSAKEIYEYIKSNKSRFKGGLGKAVAGTAAVGAAAYSAYNKLKKKD